MKKILAIILGMAATTCSLFAQNKDIEKIDRILSMMSERAQKEIKIENKEEFLSDLKTVLAEEKKYNPEDIDLYYLIDKKHYAVVGYIPKDLKPLVQNDVYGISRNDLSLRTDVEKELVKLCEAANKEGIWIVVSSTYRSYDYQDKLFQKWVRIDGLEQAERESARPGTSQHQLGTAIDFGSVTHDYINTKPGKWLDENAYKYGWSLSFPRGYEDITGYMHECWHYRFIGIPACMMQKKYFNNVQQYLLEFIDFWKKIH
ncbi:MAG: M15 family metallopeptidase [Treponema sp.]|nr:M15 family metallopeptidase [Candidatus Treponema merdequi]